MIQVKSFFLAGFFHVLLVVLLLFHLQTRQPAAGRSALRTLDAYVLSVAHQTVRTEERSKYALRKTVRQENAAVSSQNKQIAIARGERNALLERLHEVIAEHQHYPQDAQALGQAGAVMVAFKLFPNGKLDELHVVHSSGIQSLDEAAVAAVRAIDPYVEAVRYLRAPDEFTVLIEFG